MSDWSSRRQRLACLLAGSLALSPVFASQAYAFKIFGITLFGSDEETVEVIDPVRYEATIDTGDADGDLADRLGSAAALVNDDEKPVSGDLGIIVKAREDRDRL